MKENKLKKKPTHGKRKFHGLRFLTILLAVILGFEVVLGTVAVVGIQTMLKDEPELDVDDFFSQESTLIYDKDGNLIANIGNQIRENVEYDDIPESLIDAFLSIEDSRYFTHNGFDVPRFTMSVINTLLHGNVQGGSTFTMQLVKLTYFQNDETGVSTTKNVQYKIQQIDLALQLEKQASKKEIFQLYLNKMNFGGVGNIRGVQKAAEQYFGKSVSELNLSESALLAGIVNSPTYYDPRNYLDHATDRRNTVLDMMLRHGYINEDEYNLAKSINVEDLLIDLSDTYGENTFQYQAYIDEAIKEAEEITGQDPLNVSMEIYTAMDPVAQDKVEEICAGEDENVTFADDLMEVGIISENNQTGEIVAIGGGRNYTGAQYLNHATAQYKQPGSTVKPFLDYALCFEYLGWATDHELVDKPVTYGNWTFSNAGGGYYGRMNLHQALARSLNTPAIQAMQAVIDEKGTDVIIDYLKSLNFSTFDESLFDITFAIGGNAFTVSCEELMAAHAVLMNGGNYIQPHTITKIVYRSGNQADFIPEYTPVQVLSEGAAYMAGYLLYGNVYSEWFNYLQVLQRSYATYGKTGTTDWGTDGLQYGIPEGAQKDKWMVAETTGYTTVVWNGYEKAIAGENTYFTNYTGSLNTTGYICSEMMDVLQRDSTPSELQQPDSVVSIKHIRGIFPYVAPTETTSEDYITEGLVLKEYSKLGEFKADALESLSSFTAYTDGTNIIMNWSAYPDSSKLTVVDADDEASETDLSWITGRVMYKARINRNGETLAELSSESETSTQSLADSGVTITGTEQVCGYYGYEHTTDESNEVCVSVSASPSGTSSGPSGSSSSSSSASDWWSQHNASTDDSDTDSDSNNSNTNNNNTANGPSGNNNTSN